MNNEKKFAFVVDGEIFHTVSVPDVDYLQSVIAGFRSGPSVIEVTGIEDVSSSWKVIDGVLYRPVFENKVDDGPGYDLDD